MAKKSDIVILERGNVYFFYRPKVQEKEKVEPKIITDVQRLYMILHPYHKPEYRLLLVGRKRLPDIESHEKHWATVDMVTEQAKELREVFKTTTYSTKTKGERVQPEIRACGEGVYSIASAQKNTYFAYELEFPKQPQDVQEKFNIASQASYVISVKNQFLAGINSAQAANFPEKLKRKFHDLRFVPVDPPEFLSYPGAEILLIGAMGEVGKELENKMEKNEKDFDRDKIFNDLRLWKNKHTTKPLFAGEWV